MKRIKVEFSLAAALIAAAFACISCGPPLREVGRFNDDKADAVFIVYYLKKDLPEAELKEMLKPVARQMAGSDEFVVQLVVYDKAYAEKLVSDESADKFRSGELLVGLDLVEDPSAKTKGGVVYTYYKNGEYDEWFYAPRQ